MILRSTLLFLFAFATVYAQTTTAPTVRFKTTLGDIDVLLLPGSAPETVKNFLRYMNKKAYDNSVFHRSVRGFIIQGGGFSAALPNLSAIPADPPVVNEYRESSIRGTLAMAKLGDYPNSATNQWFFNLGDNTGSLDPYGNFSPFGTVVEGMEVVDKLNGEYGEQPTQSRISSSGNEYLQRQFPALDYIKSARVVP